MISEEEARAKILDTIRPLPAQNVPLSQAVDCFAAQDYFARLPLPNFDNSAMDGYAVIASDCTVGGKLRVVGEQPAGLDRQLQVSKGEAVRIFTGATLPSGADAVVMQEDVTRDGDEIVLNTKVEPSEFVRRRGCDLGKGQKIVSAGERIRPVTAALLASQGFAEVSVGGKARVGIISTGNELAHPGEKLQAGQIFESNSVLLRGLVERSGGNVTSTAHTHDDLDSLGKTFQVSTENDILIVTGGVSVGEHDLVQQSLRSLGAKIDIWRVAIKPGKPFMFGHLGYCAVFGLPGNPVSAFVTFLRFVRPAIWKLTGAMNFTPPQFEAKLLVDLTNNGDRAHYVRGKFQNGTFTPVGRQESHALFGLSQSNALLRIDAGESIAAGSKVEVELVDL
jgi:molybdopterin molybdotransferase